MLLYFSSSLHYEKIDSHLNDELKKVIKDQVEKSTKNGARVVMNETESMPTKFVENIKPEPTRVENDKNVNDLPKIESNIEQVEQETLKKKSHISFIENDKR